MFYYNQNDYSNTINNDRKIYIKASTTTRFPFLKTEYMQNVH